MEQPSCEPCVWFFRPVQQRAADGRDLGGGREAPQGAQNAAVCMLRLFSGTSQPCPLGVLIRQFFIKVITIGAFFYPLGPAVPLPGHFYDIIFARFWSKIFWLLQGVSYP